MDWEQIMKMDNPHEALKQIDAKIRRENLSLLEMEEMTEKYASLHNISVAEMATYPNGERVITP